MWPVDRLVLKGIASAEEIDHSWEPEKVMDFNEWLDALEEAEG